MHWAGAGVVLVVLSTACADRVFVSEPPLTPTPPLVSPAPPPVPSAPGQTIYRSIAVGEKVTGTLESFDTWVIDLTVGSSGVAVVRLAWQADLTWMDLKWDEQFFKGPQRLGEATIVARKSVDAGRPSRLTILDAYPWENYHSSFVLETSLE